MKAVLRVALFLVVAVQYVHGIESITGDPLEVSRAFSRSLALEQRFVERVDRFSDRYRNRPGNTVRYPDTLLGGSILYFGLDDVPVVYNDDEVTGGVHYLATEAYALWQQGSRGSRSSRYWLVAGTAGAIYEPYVNILDTSARIEDAREREDVYLAGGGYEDVFGILLHGSNRPTFGVALSTVYGISYRTRFSGSGSVEARSLGLNVASILGWQTDRELRVQARSIGESILDLQGLETQIDGGIRLPLEAFVGTTPLWVRGYSRLAGARSLSGAAASVEYGGSYDNPVGTWEYLYGRESIHAFSIGVGASYTGREQLIGGYRFDDHRTGFRLYGMYATVAGVEVSLNHDAVLQDFPEFRDRALLRLWISVR